MAKYHRGRRRADARLRSVLPRKSHRGRLTHRSRSRWRVSRRSGRACNWPGSAAGARRPRCRRRRVRSPRREALRGAVRCPARRRVYRWCTRIRWEPRSSGALRNRLIEALPTEQQIRDRPARDENADDEIAETGKPAVESADKIPEAAFEAELAGDEAERLNAADQERDHDGDRGDGEIVPNLANRIEKRPAIGADHQHAVR